MPSAKNLDITLIMSFMALFILAVCRSVLIVEGKKPAFIAGKHNSPHQTNQILYFLRIIFKQHIVSVKF